MDFVLTSRQEIDASIPVRTAYVAIFITGTGETDHFVYRIWSVFTFCGLPTARMCSISKPGI